jgi:hypothetical protein
MFRAQKNSLSHVVVLPIPTESQHLSITPLDTGSLITAPTLILVFSPQEQGLASASLLYSEDRR